MPQALQQLALSAAVKAHPGVMLPCRQVIPYFATGYCVVLIKYCLGSFTQQVVSSPCGLAIWIGKGKRT